MFLNTKIQSKGEQKYYDFIKVEAERINLGMVIWISLFAAAVITVFSHQVIALILVIIGIGLAITNLKRRQAIDRKLDGVKDKKEFYLQLSRDDVLEMKEFPIIITRQYVVCKTDDVYIYNMEDMKKIKVEVQKETQKKVLFLTNADGTRHEVISCMENSEEEPLFDEVLKRLQSGI